MIAVRTLGVRELLNIKTSERREIDYGGVNFTASRECDYAAR